MSHQVLTCFVMLLLNDSHGWGHTEKLYFEDHPTDTWRNPGALVSPLFFAADPMYKCLTNQKKQLGISYDSFLVILYIHNITLHYIHTYVTGYHDLTKKIRRPYWNDGRGNYRKISKDFFVVI